jgi:hypothetical protein
MTIRLTSLDQMPQDIRSALQRFDSVVGETPFMETLLQNPDLHRIAIELDRLCVPEGVIGFHFTRALREEIEARGLEICSGHDRRRQFLAKYGTLFSEAKRKWMRRAWKNYFDKDQTAERDGRIWFNLTLGALDDGGADDLLTYFGGEVINMPLTQDEEVAAVLQTLGQPLIVECALSAEALHACSEIPWGRTWLSTYHVSINQDAYGWDVDAYSIEPVPPGQIVSVRVARPCGRSNSSIHPTRWGDARG